MALPDYKRPFSQEDFRGYFRWSKKFSKELGGKLYHACHQDELEDIVMRETLGLRSQWSIELPNHGTWSAPGTWTGLNYFAAGNGYGPCLIEFPIEVLNGRHFMVYRRVGERHGYFFVQYEARIPIFSFGKDIWRQVEPRSYFAGSGKDIGHKTGAIYDIVVTQPIPLANAVIDGVDHPYCIPGKCGGSRKRESRRLVDKIAKMDWKWYMENSRNFNKVMKRYPLLEGAEVELFNPEGS